MKNLEKKKKNLKILKLLSNNDIQVLEKLNKCNKQAKTFIKDVIKLNPYFWDYGYLLDIEYSYLKRLRETLLEENLFIGCKRACEQIQTCLKLLDIIQNKRCSIKLNFKLNCWEIKKYVNLRNASRFFKDIKTFENIRDNSENGKALAVDALYNAKAWYLYNEMRKYFMQNWWS